MTLDKVSWLIGLSFRLGVLVAGFARTTNAQSCDSSESMVLPLAVRNVSHDTLATTRRILLRWTFDVPAGHPWSQRSLESVTQQLRDSLGEAAEDALLAIITSPRSVRPGVDLASRAAFVYLKLGFPANHLGGIVLSDRYGVRTANVVFDALRRYEPMLTEHWAIAKATACRVANHVVAAHQGTPRDWKLFLREVLWALQDARAAGNAASKNLLNDSLILRAASALGPDNPLGH